MEVVAQVRRNEVSKPDHTTRSRKMKKGVVSKLSLELTSFIFLCFLCMPVSTAAEEYVINPGDTISVLVWGHAQYTQIIPVRPDGKITYPFLGEIKVDGLTTTDLSERIREVLLKHLIDPQVTVAVTQPKKNEVFILGQVRFPNQFRFEQDRLDLLKALSMAGGVLDEMADLQNVRIIRDDGTSMTIDLEQLLTSEPQQFVFLSSGDLVYVPNKERVSVSGHVMAPGEHKTRSSLGVRQALALAGGPMQDTANLSNVLLFKSTGEVVEVDLSGYLRAGENGNRDCMLINFSFLLAQPMLHSNYSLVGSEMRQLFFARNIANGIYTRYIRLAVSIYLYITVFQVEA